MQQDRSPMVLNILLALVLGFAIYLGLLFMDHQQKIGEEISKAAQSPKPVPATDHPVVLPSSVNPKEEQLPSAPLFIKDDIAKLIGANVAIKEVMKGYRKIGLDLGHESYSIRLNEDGSLQEVSKGLDSALDFTMKSSPEDFRRITLLAKHGNLLGLVERFNEMEFSPSGAKQEFINKLHNAQGFTSQVRKP